MIAIAAVVSTLIGGGALVASNAFAQSTPPTVQAGNRRVEKHPAIRKAMRQLNMAWNTMKRANDDFAGHKEAALDATHRAIVELQAALKADRR
ncbi:MAG: hypothetical protein ACYC96_05315 [Fimbriimonadaceae bacterium]